MENRPPVEVAIFGAVVRPRQERPVPRPEDGCELVRRPGVEDPLFPLGVGVECRVEASLRPPQVAEDEVQRLAHHPEIPPGPGDLIRVEVSHGQQRLVVEHLLEVRHQPAGIDRVAVETAAEMVVDPARGHPVESDGCGLESCEIARPAVVAQEKLDTHRVRELRRAAEAAVFPVETPHEGRRCPAEQRSREQAPSGGNVREGGDPLGDAPSTRLHFLAACAPDLGQPLQHGPESCAAAAVLGRKVGAAEERATVRCEPGAERPAAVSAHELHGRHVDIIEVGTLLPVDLDGDELVVEVRGDRLILERLAFHDVAPVAGRIADGEEDRLVLAPRLRKRLLPPRMPVDRVIRVLAQVRAGLGEETVRPADESAAVVVGPMGHVADRTMALGCRDFIESKAAPHLRPTGV